MSKAGSDCSSQQSHSINHTEKIPVHLNDADKTELIINLVTFQINTAFYKETRANLKKNYLRIKSPLEVDVLTYDL